MGLQQRGRELSVQLEDCLPTRFIRRDEGGASKKVRLFFLSGGLWPFEVMGTGLGGSGDTASSNSVSQGFDGNVQVVQLGAKRL